MPHKSPASSSFLPCCCYKNTLIIKGQLTLVHISRLQFKFVTTIMPTPGSMQVTQLPTPISIAQGLSQGKVLPTVGWSSLPNEHSQNDCRGLSLGLLLGGSCQAGVNTSHYSGVPSFCCSSIFCSHPCLCFLHCVDTCLCVSTAMISVNTTPFLIGPIPFLHL